MKPKTTMPDPVCDEARAELRELMIRKSVCHGEFTLVSGAKSDFYVDSKLTTLDPRGARLIGVLGWDIVREWMKESGRKVDAIGGLTMGADPIALTISLRSEELGEPIQTFCVRKEAKKHGRTKRIEGNFEEGFSTVIVDDVATTGGSTIKAIEAVEEAGGNVALVIVLVDRQEGGVQTIEKRGYRVAPLFTRKDLTETAATR